MRPFLSEWNEREDIHPEGAKQSLRWTISLLSSSAIGLFAEIVRDLKITSIDYPSLVLIASWVRSC